MKRQEKQVTLKTEQTGTLSLKLKTQQDKDLNYTNKLQRMD